MYYDISDKDSHHGYYQKGDDTNEQNYFNSR